MKKSGLFVIIIFISAALCGLWLFTTFFRSPPETAIANVEKPPANTINERNKKIPIDYERNTKLQTESDALLTLFDKMPQVPIFLKDEVINKEGTNTERGVAYTTCENNNKPTIFMKKVFYEKANRKQLVNILKHELTHAWQCRRQYTWGHDEKFRKKFKQVGGFGN